MNPVCKIHGTPLSGWQLECPACTIDEERHSQLRELHEDQRAALERQIELQREAAETAAERAIEEQWALDEIAVTAQQRLTEEREHRKSEARKAILRAGVRELSSELQTRWRDVNHTRDALKELVSRHRASSEAAQRSLAERRKDCERELTRLTETQRGAFERAIEVRDPSIMTALYTLPDNQIGDADIARTLERALADAVASAAPFFRIRPSRDGSAPRLLSDLAQTLRHLEEAGRAAGKPSFVTAALTNNAEAAGWVIGLSSLYAIGSIVFTSLSPWNPKGAEIILGLLVYAAIFGAPIVIGLFSTRILRRTAEVRDEPRLRFLKHLKALQAMVGTRTPGGTYEALIRHLVRAYIAAHPDRAPDSAQLIEALRLFRDETQTLENAARALTTAIQQQEEVVREYQFLEAEVLRVGREVVEGIRAPGRFLLTAKCPNCGGSVTSETRTCPYCGSERVGDGIVD